jgi:6-phosphofructo-2-kinase / fructose-2,6-biphosphatase 4
VFWVESICNKPNVVLKNIQSTKLDCDQYRGLNLEDAQKDFLHKIERMAERYEEIDNEKSYIKLIDIGDEV